MSEQFIISYQIKTALMVQDQILSVNTSKHQMRGPSNEPNVILMDILDQHIHEKVVGFEILDIRKNNVQFNEDFHISLS